MSKNGPKRHLSEAVDTVDKDEEIELFVGTVGARGKLLQALEEREHQVNIESTEKKRKNSRPKKKSKQSKQKQITTRHRKQKNSDDEDEGELQQDELQQRQVQHGAEYDLDSDDEALLESITARKRKRKQVWTADRLESLFEFLEHLEFLRERHRLKDDRAQKLSQLVKATEDSLEVLSSYLSSETVATIQRHLSAISKGPSPDIITPATVTDILRRLRSTLSQSPAESESSREKTSSVLFPYSHARLIVDLVEDEHGLTRAVEHWRAKREALNTPLLRRFQLAETLDSWDVADVFADDILTPGFERSMTLSSLAAMLAVRADLWQLENLCGLVKQRETLQARIEP